MIASTLLIFSLLAAPDLYFQRENGDVAVASVRSKLQSLHACIRTLLPNGVGVCSQSKDIGFIHLHTVERPMSSRVSIVNESVWALNLLEINSGVQEFRAVARLSLFPISGLKREDCAPDRIRDLVLLKPETLAGQSSAAISAMLDPPIQRPNPMLSYGDYKFWNIEHYSEVVRRLIPDDFPYATITAINSKLVVVSIYMNGKMIFIEMQPRKLASDETLELWARLPFDSKGDALEWKSLNVVETDLDSWATGIWAEDDSLNLIGDDGYCEQFKLVNGTFKRTGQTSGLPAPAAICHVGSDIWLLSEKDEAIKATKVSWDGSTSHSEFNLGRTSLEAAAQIVFDPDELAWRVNYSLFISVLPFLIAALVVMFVIWRVVKARRLSRSG